MRPAKYINTNNIREIRWDSEDKLWICYFVGDGLSAGYVENPLERKPVPGYPGWVDMTQTRYDAGKINIGPDEDLRPWTIPGHDPH